MSEYRQQALDFLNASNATMEIKFAGCGKNSNWGEHVPRNHYDVTITTPRGTMELTFWDSLYNTNCLNMTVDEYSVKTRRMHYKDLYNSERREVEKEVKEIKKNTKPNEYDVLACLQKYDVGTMDDFFSEFGYEVHSATDMFNFMTTYNACLKEYSDLCRIFTAEQMEALREIY